MNNLRALIAAATPGPWIEDSADQPTAPFGTIFRDDADDWDDRTWLFDPREGTTEDAQLIVAAVNALPGLLDVVEAARRYTADPVGKTTSQIMADFDAIRYALAHLEDPK